MSAIRVHKIPIALNNSQEEILISPQTVKKAQEYWAFLHLYDIIVLR